MKTSNPYISTTAWTKSETSVTLTSLDKPGLLGTYLVIYNDARSAGKLVFLKKHDKCRGNYDC